MSAQSMLEQLLKSGLSLLDKPDGTQPPAEKGSASTPASQEGQTNWGQLGAVGAAGGVLGLLLGTKSGRKVGGAALKYGSMAALSVAAVKAYKNWQTGQAPIQSSGQSDQDATSPVTNIPLLAAPEVEANSQAILKAMLAVAKSDGHLDEREQALIQAELARTGAEPALQSWMQAELSRPLDPAEVALAATTPELAAQMYLASLLIADETSFMERAYLDELAKQLKLAPELKAQLESQSVAI